MAEEKGKDFNILYVSRTSHQLFYHRDKSPAFKIGSGILMRMVKETFAALQIKRQHKVNEDDMCTLLFDLAMDKIMAYQCCFQLSNIFLFENFSLEKLLTAVYLRTNLKKIYIFPALETSEHPP